MVSKESESALWKFLDQFKDDRQSSNYITEKISISPNAVLETIAHSEFEISWDEIYPFLSPFRNSDFTLPNYVIDFLVKYILGNQIEKILCPWSGYGVIPTALKEKKAGKTIIGIDPDVRKISISEQISKKLEIQWEVGKPLSILQGFKDEFDAIVSSPPVGLQRINYQLRTIDGELEIRDSETNIFVLEAARKLSETGEAIFVLPNNFPWERRGNAFSLFRKFELYVHSIIALPKNVIAPWSRIELNLIFINHKEPKKVFVSYLDPDKSFDDLLEDIQRHRQGEQPSGGYLINIKDFRSWQSLLIDDQIQIEAKKSGTKVIDLGSIAKSVQIGKHREEDGGFSEKPNSVFLPLMGTSPAVTRISDLTIKPQKYAQIALDDEKAFADYVAGYFNTNLGGLVRERLSQGGVISRIRASDLNTAPVLLPDIESQIEIVNFHNSLQDTILFFEKKDSELWKQPEKLIDIKKEIEVLQHKEKTGFEDWMNSLPFPLASILWRYTATDRIDQKIEHLFHFFEAFAQFATTYMLSCFYSDKEYFVRNKSKWIDVNGEFSKIFSRASFGNWVVVGERLAKHTRRLLSDKKTRSDVFVYYHTEKDDFIETIIGKRLFGILKDVNSYRNDWQGHGGISGEFENQRRLAAMETELRVLREIVGNVFSGFAVLLPQEAKQSKGIFYYKAKNIMGTINTPFKTIEIETNTSLEDGALYFMDLSRRDPIKFISFIKMLPSPKTESNACYFYNRLEKDSVRWVSYQFDQQPEINQVDDGLLEFFAILDE